VRPQLLGHVCGQLVDARFPDPAGDVSSYLAAPIEETLTIRPFPFARSTPTRPTDAGSDEPDSSGSGGERSAARCRSL
jgi:hypothetical protein